MTTNRRNVWPRLKACFVVLALCLNCRPIHFVNAHSITFQILPNWNDLIANGYPYKDQRGIMKKILDTFFGTRNSILNENFVWDYNLRLISNFQNPNIHTQNKNLKARPTLFHSSGFHCRPRQNLFWLLYFFASKFHQPCQSTPVRFKLYVHFV